MKREAAGLEREIEAFEAVLDEAKTENAQYWNQHRHAPVKIQQPAPLRLEMDLAPDSESVQAAAGAR